MLYIHIPYCSRKCLYCDFYSGGAKIADWHRLAQAICAELRSRVAELPPEITSIYIGGGTPSLMPADIFTSMMSDIRAILADRGVAEAPDAEFTVEVNPEDVDDAKIQAWQQAGVNRVSVGVQTFSHASLRAIGRNHSPAAARRALEVLCRNFSNVSADLIFGLPAQSLQDLEHDIDTLLSYPLKHISIYSLMFEEGTALTHLRDAGRIEEADEETVAEMYELIRRRLSQAGFEHYETSNYARLSPDSPAEISPYRSRHNSGYWIGRPYLGLGPSAHSYDGAAIRRANPADLKAYLRHFAPTKNNPITPIAPVAPITPITPIAPITPIFYQEEHLSQEERREEFIMLSLRRREGIDLEQYRRLFGAAPLRQLLNKANPHIKAGTMKLHQPKPAPDANPDSSPEENPNSSPTSRPDSSPTPNPDSSLTPNPDSSPTSNPDSSLTSLPAPQSLSIAPEAILISDLLITSLI